MACVTNSTLWPAMPPWALSQSTVALACCVWSPSFAFPDGSMPPVPDAVSSHWKPNVTGASDPVGPPGADTSGATFAGTAGANVARPGAALPGTSPLPPDPSAGPEVGAPSVAVSPSANPPGEP